MQIIYPYQFDTVAIHPKANFHTWHLILSLLWLIITGIGSCLPRTTFILKEEQGTVVYLVLIVHLAIGSLHFTQHMYKFTMNI